MRERGAHAVGMEAKLFNPYANGVGALGAAPQIAAA
jgi:hypothetical protein